MRSTPNSRLRLLLPLLLGAGAAAADPPSDHASASLRQPITLDAPPAWMDDSGTWAPNQDLSSSSDVGWKLTSLEDLPRDAGHLLSSPLRWNSGDWLLAGGLTLAGIGLYQEDRPIQRWFSDHRSAGADRLARTVKPFGASYEIIALAGTAALSFAVPDPRLTRTAILGSESTLFAMGLYEVLQLSVQRTRPSQGGDPDDVQPFQLHAHGHSFPSGHATAAAALAGVVAEEWRSVPGVPETAYGLALLVGWARLEANAHWATDVAAGEVIGFACATAVEHLHTPRNLTIAPILDHGRRGLEVAFAF